MALRVERAVPAPLTGPLPIMGADVGPLNALFSSAYVRTFRPLSRRPMPGSSRREDGVIVCMSTSGLPFSLAG